MILTDGVHIVSTESLDELHRFVKKLGFKKVWFQKHRIPHYDLLSERVLLTAIRLGAKKVTTKQLIRQMREDNG